MVTGASKGLGGQIARSLAAAGAAVALVARNQEYQALAGFLAVIASLVIKKLYW